jgi:PKD repeat protein
LKAISEFGCEHEITKSFTLNESPKADFTFSDPCNLKDVDFTRTGSLPSGNSIFQWDLDGETVSTKENPSHLFAQVGVKKVSLLVSSDNGCSDMITKEFVVKLQSKADFVANNVCEGEEVVFTNKSAVAKGNLNYIWRLGDGNVSNLTSPRHPYSLNDPQQSESFQVTLVAVVPGGCSDSIAKTVTVNASSDPMFTATTNWRNLSISSQATTDASNIYNWRFGDGGKSSMVTPSYEYTNVDNGTFQVCLNIINQAGCASQHCENVEINLGTSSVNDLDNSFFAVYPNPSNGVFNVKIDNASDNTTINIIDAMGKNIKTITANGVNGVYNIDISNVASGVYFVQVSNGTNTGMQKVTITE